jgi:hypothetical protein
MADQGNASPLLPAQRLSKNIYSFIRGVSPSIPEIHIHHLRKETKLCLLHTASAIVVVPTVPANVPHRAAVVSAAG